MPPEKAGALLYLIPTILIGVFIVVVLQQEPDLTHTTSTLQEFQRANNLLVGVLVAVWLLAMYGISRMRL